MSTNDIKHLAAETIYLVPDSSEGQRCYLWCDDPAPGLDMDPSESVEYLRKDVHDAIIAKQANAAKSGMDAAKKVAGSNLEQAKRLHAECNPQALESEREANARLTEQIAKLEAHIAALKDDIEIHRVAEETQIALRQKMEKERDKQAAYLDRLSRAIGACMSNDERKFVFSPDDYLELEHALDATFSESLARRDALNKAGAMDWVLAQSCNEENEGVMWRTKIVEPEIQRLRQQAEGPQ